MTSLTDPIVPPDTEVAVGQRRVNLLWERTQAVIALSVTWVSLAVAVILSLRVESDNTAFIFVSNLAFTIVGFYFGRTNHQRQGGVGPHDAGR